MKPSILLAIDVGNTQTVIGLHEPRKKWIAHWRLETKKERTSDELIVFIKELIKLKKVSIAQISGIILSSVVPVLDRPFAEMAERYFKLPLLKVGPKLKMNIQIALPNPLELGADRIVNAVAAYQRYGGPIIIVDFGTATTFDYIDKKGAYQGGIIAPGPQIAANALFHAAAKLPQVDLSAPPRVLGRNTVHSVQSGLYFGYLALIDGLIARLRGELKQQIRAIATGGLSPLFADASETIACADPFLTLDGLVLLYEWNQAAGSASKASSRSKKRAPSAPSKTR